MFALLVGPVIGPLLKRQTGVSLPTGILLASATVFLHDLLDILQSTDRQPFWPFITVPVGTHISIIPKNPASEALLFASLCLLALAVFRFIRRHLSSTDTIQRLPGDRLQTWSERVIIAAILATAVTCYHLRTQRLHDFQQIMPSLRQQNYQKMLTVLTQVDRWPGIGKPGRIDYFRGLTYMKMGSTDAAEQHLLRAYRQDPEFFWSVADLALAYASSDRPAKTRAALTAPLLEELRKNFPTHPDLPEYLRKIQAYLDPGQDDPSTTPAARPGITPPARELRQQGQPDLQTDQDTPVHHYLSARSGSGPARPRAPRARYCVDAAAHRPGP